MNLISADLALECFEVNVEAVRGPLLWQLAGSRQEPGTWIYKKSLERRPRHLCIVVKRDISGCLFAARTNT